MNKVLAVVVISSLAACSDDDGGSPATQAMLEASAAHAAFATVLCKCASDPTGAICTEEGHGLECFATMDRCLESLAVAPADWRPTICQQEAYDGDTAGIIAYARCVEDLVNPVKICLDQANCQPKAISACIQGVDIDATCDFPESVDAALETCKDIDTF